MKALRNPQVVEALEGVRKSIESGSPGKRVEILKAEERTITGIVLQPEVVDAQGDVYDAAVIRKAAHEYLAKYNKKTKTGVQHKDFKPKMSVVESYLAPAAMAIGSKLVKEGTWILVAKVHDDKLWDAVKKRRITGFSIGGKAKVQNLNDAG